MNTSVIKISPDQVKRALALCIKSNIVPILWGPVGVGKTTAVNDFVQSLNDRGIDANLRITILSQCDISDFALPKEINNRVVQIPAAWIPLAEDERVDDPFTFIFFDEIDRCSPDIQNLAMNLILGRNIAGKKISSKCYFFGAGNSSSDIYTTQLSKAFINRVCSLYIGQNFDSYEKWATNNGISPARIAFQKFHAESLIDSVDEFEDISIATNRSLDAADRVTEIIKSGKVNFPTTDIYNAVIAGLIGVAAAMEYRQFNELYNKMPMPDVILKNPKGFDSSDLEPSVLYAVTQSVVRYAADDLDNCEKAFQFLSTLSPEFRNAGCTNLIQRNPDSVTCKTYMALNNANQ